MSEQMYPGATVVRARLTHLAPRGTTDVQFAMVEEPSIDAALAVAEAPSLDHELAFVDFEQWIDVRVPRGGRGKSVDLARTPSRPIGETFVATDWHEGEYALRSIKSVLRSKELPLYTAEWLGRYMQTLGAQYRNETKSPASIGSLFDFDLLRTRKFHPDDRPRLTAANEDDPKAPKRDSENAQERAQRLTHLLAQTRPDMAQRFLSRGIGFGLPERRTV